MNVNNLPFNWFDLVILGFLLVGFRRGRKQGFSVELVAMLTWLGIIFGCAYAYEPLGLQIARSAASGKLLGYVAAYVLGALVIASLFGLLKKSLGGKLLGSDVFGRGEFYLGMFAGVVRFACILVAALALLNARSYTTAEVKAQLKFQDENFGSNFFPTLHTVQSEVFERSLAGRWVKKELAFLLIKPTAPDQNQPPQQKEFAMP